MMRIEKAARLVLTVGLVLGAAGCASILSDSQYPVTFNSNPSGAVLTITDRGGDVVFEGQSPTTVTLRSGAGFFRGAQYTVQASLGDQQGLATLTPGVDGWYIGNILFGGLIGILIVDPATGAMYKLPGKFTVNMASTATGVEPALTIMSIGDVPEDLQQELIALD